MVRPKLKQTWLLLIHLPAGISFSDLKDKEEYFSSAVGGTCEIERNGEAVYMIISNIPLEKEYTYSFDPTPYLKTMKLPILIGHGANGPVVQDLTVILSLLVVGLRGKGKSTLFHQVIYTLLLLNKFIREDYVQVAIIGPKNKEFEYFEDYGATFVHEEEDYLQLLKFIDKADRQRKNKLGRCRDILEYNSIKGNHMPYVALLVDEVDMVGENKECAELLLRSVKKYRSQGIYVIAATQRPSAKSWGNANQFSEFKSQFEARVAFRMSDAINSQMILESNKAALIPKTPGRAIYKYDTEEEVQTPNFPSQGKQFNFLMEQLPKVPLPYHDITGEVCECESNYPRPRTQARSTSSGASRSLKMLVSGTNPLT
jgi:S-DNA-T family DNA segregation ATPase FtsK/SpoIIIE